MKNIWISIVDDHSLFTTSLAATLNSQKGISVAFTANNGIDFFNKLKTASKRPDVVLMDLEMPEMDGIEATKKLKRLHPEIKVIIITMHEDESFILTMMSNGVEGYLFKNVEPSELVLAIDSVYQGDKYYNVTALSAIAHRFANQNKPQHGFNSNSLAISKRELEVLELLCEAKTTKEIGDALNISERTVETHRINLLSKTNSKNTIALVLFALYNNIVKSNRRFVFKDVYKEI